MWDRVTGSQTTINDMGFGAALGDDVAMLAAIAVVAPLAEELLFRGLLHRGLRDLLLTRLPAGWSIAVATKLSSVAFQQIHLDPEQMQMAPVYLLVGALTALTYEFAGSIYASIAVQAATNAFALAQASEFGHALASAVSLVFVLAPAES